MLRQVIWTIVVVSGIVEGELVLPAPENAIELNSTEGFAMLGRSYSSAYQQMSQHLTTQQSESLCGIASAVTVLNSLPIAAPVDPSYAPYPYYTQEYVLKDACVLKIHNPSFGLTRTQLATILDSCFPVEVQNVNATLNYREFRSTLIRALLTSGRGEKTRVIVNFYRQDLEEAGFGHFSPVAAYDRDTDYVLILDVARYKYPPLWVSIKDLWSAVIRRDPSDANDERRGLLLITPSLI